MVTGASTSALAVEAGTFFKLCMLFKGSIQKVFSIQNKAAFGGAGALVLGGFR